MSFKQDLGPRVRSWLHERLTERPDPYPILEAVLSQLPTTPQRRHRWWPFGRGAAPVPASGRAPARGFTMFSAVTFIAASVIVALFGGFLLAGVLTTQQGDETAPAAVIESPAPEVTNETTEPPTTSVRTDILPGVELTVDEVEPGVFRVVDDGVRDLASKNNLDIVAGHDGGIWLQRPQRFVRLGGDEWLAWPNKKHGALIGVAPDGTVWAVSGEHLYSVGRGSDDWTRATGPAGGFSLMLIEGSNSWVTSDGTVWAKWWDPAPNTKVIGYLGADGWQPVAEWPGKPWSKFEELLVSDRGDIWHRADGLQHFVDGAWRTYDGWPSLAWGAAVGPDGTFWGASRNEFVRFDGTERMTFARPDWVPDGRRRPSPTTDTLRVAPDGSVWVGPTRTDRGTRGDTRRPCRGVGHFDGVTWGRYLPDLCVEAMDVAADGAVWVLASRDDTDDSLPNHVYVITPEAVAATK